MSLSLTAVDWVVCLLGIAGSIWLGLYLAVRGRVSESSANFFLAGRKLTWPIVGASLFASNIGAEHLVGLSGDAYRYGLCAGAVELTTFICLGFAASFLFPYYIRNTVFTIPEFLEMRYSRAARSYFSGLMLVICIMTKLAFHLYAGGLVLHGLLGWNVMTGVVLAGVVVAIITVLGGFTAVAYTDSLQSAIMIAGCDLMSLIGIERAGGWHALVAAAPAAMSIAKPYGDPNYPFWGIIAGALYGGIFYWGMDQVNVQRVLGARDLRQARWGSMFTVLLKLTPVFIFALPGVIAYVLFPGREAKTAFITLLNELLPNGIRGIVLAALMASLISSNLSVMNSVSTLASGAGFRFALASRYKRERTGSAGALRHRGGRRVGYNRRVPGVRNAGRALQISPDHLALSGHADCARGGVRDHEQACYGQRRAHFGAGRQRARYPLCSGPVDGPRSRRPALSVAPRQAHLELRFSWVLGRHPDHHYPIPGLHLHREGADRAAGEAHHRLARTNRAFPRHHRLAPAVGFAQHGNHRSLCVAMVDRSK
jgi:SSS family transporter